MWVRLTWLTLSVAMISQGLSTAGAVVVTGDVADRYIRKDGSRVNAVTGRVGAATTGNDTAKGCRVAVFVFQLPTPSAGQDATVLAATLQFAIAADNADGTYGIDLYGLGARVSSAVLSTDNYAGSSDSTDAWLIQKAIVPAVHADAGPETVWPDSGGNDKLVTYLNAQYGPTGSGAGRYVFLRLNPDADPPVEDSGVDVVFADNVTDAPTLSITFAPEPGPWVAALPALACLLRRPRDRGRGSR